jgi:hypothetical protein
MNECTEIPRVRSIDSFARRNSSPNGRFLSRVWAKLRAEIGSGLRKPPNYDETDEIQLEQKAREDLAIAKARGF